MAKPTSKGAAALTSSKSSNGASAPDIMEDAPAGFRQATSESNAPWVAGDKGNVCFGKVLGRYPMNVQPPRWYYQIELLAPCKVRVGKGEDAEITDAAVGDIVNLNENYRVGVLKEIVIPEVLAGAEWRVWVKFRDKQKIGGGKTMWDIVIKTNQDKPPTSPVRALPSDVQGEGGTEEAPF
jgi:hypothetical protein